MRSYTININDVITNKLLKTYTSLITLKDGTKVTNGAALLLRFNFPSACYNDPMGSAWLQLSGIDFRDISQSSNFNGQIFTLIAGMAKGLPLANPKQSGVILTGVIQQCFGNWQGNSVTLDFIISAKSGSPSQPQNIPLDWVKGQKLSIAINKSLSIAYPKSITNVNISDKLVYSEDSKGFYEDMEQYSQEIYQLSKSIINDKLYQGVKISPTDTGFNVFDGTVAQSNVTQISFNDLIGNVTWIDNATIQFKCVLRADLSIGGIITMPKGINLINTAQSYTQYRDKISFQGNFQINNINHFGDSRNPDANSWVTTIEAYTLGFTP